MDFIEMTGKTAEEAIEKALKLLDVSREETDVEIVDAGSKGFFGLGHKPAKVVVKLKDNPARLAKNFIREVSSAMGLNIITEAVLSDRTLNIDLKGENIGVLIGKHGQTLDSLQYLTNLVVNKNREQYVNISVDTENYRAKRKETLEGLAKNMAKKVRQTKRPVRLEPMSPSERRVIHAALQGEKQIVTFSEGIEPFRNVIISFKREGSESSEGSKEGGRYPNHNRYKQQSHKSGQRVQKDNYSKFLNINDKNGGEKGGE